MKTIDVDNTVDILDNVVYKHAVLAYLIGINVYNIDNQLHDFYENMASSVGYSTFGQKNLSKYFIPWL